VRHTHVFVSNEKSKLIRNSDLNIWLEFSTIIFRYKSTDESPNFQRGDADDDQQRGRGRERAEDLGGFPQSVESLFQIVRWTLFRNWGKILWTTI